MNADYALTLWRADLVRFTLHDHRLKIAKAVISNHTGLHRRYHGLDHLGFLFSQIEAMSEQITDLPRLVYTAWFHDVVYRSWRKDNETLSAQRAQTALGTMGAGSDLIERVHALIVKTADHSTGGDDDDCLFLDMDCAILGAQPDIYDRYTRQIRFEYGWAPPHLYRKGRAAFIRSQLNRKTLFHTAAYRDQYEDQARLNLHAELTKLQR